jgi:hypothetical protein
MAMHPSLFSRPISYGRADVQFRGHAPKQQRDRKSPADIFAARALLGWSQTDLAGGIKNGPVFA